MCLQRFDINDLEMLAIFRDLNVLLLDKTSIHVGVMSDNSIAVMVLRNVDTIQLKVCDGMCKLLWEWCIGLNIWPATLHIAGKLNIIADSISRNKELPSSEWKIDPIVARYFLRDFLLCQILIIFIYIRSSTPEVNSYQPDTSAYAADAVFFQGIEHDFYAFPLLA